LMSGIWKRRHGQLIRHRQPKGSETVKAEPTSTASDLDSTPNRASRVVLPYDVTPLVSCQSEPQQLCPISRETRDSCQRPGRRSKSVIGVHVVRQVDAGSPGSGGASPYLPPDFHRRRSKIEDENEHEHEDDWGNRIGDLTKSPESFLLPAA
jgi:hypothetical protein